MTEKDGPDKMFGKTIRLEDQPFMNDNKEIQDSDEEIIELTDPDKVSIPESEEEIIEPADFLDELSVDDTNFADQDIAKIPSFDDDEDIIELTDTVGEKPKGTNISQKTSSSDSSLTSDDKDLFIFTDSGNEAFLEDDDILSDTVFADEPSKGNFQHIDREPDVFTQEKEAPAKEDISIFDDTVFANEPSEADKELAVLSEIDDTSQQIENGMFSDTVFTHESLKNDEEELAVLAEIDDNKMDEENVTDSSSGFTDEPSLDNDNDMVLLEDTESESLIGDVEEGFIQSDTSDHAEGGQLEIEAATDGDIADSLGMDLESKVRLSEDAEIEDDIELIVEPELENLKPGAKQFEPGAFEGIEFDTAQIDQQKQTVSSEPFSIQPDQLEELVEKVISKMLGKKIDSMIMDVIEKAVKTDIDKIKKELLKSATDDS